MAAAAWWWWWCRGRAGSGPGRLALQAGGQAGRQAAGCARGRQAGNVWGRQPSNQGGPEARACCFVRLTHSTAFGGQTCMCAITSLFEAHPQACLCPQARRSAPHNTHAYAHKLAYPHNTHAYLAWPRKVPVWRSSPGLPRRPPPVAAAPAAAPQPAACAGGTTRPGCRLSELLRLE